MKPTSESKNFELLLPVGQKEMALAAIHYGADAIFMGMPGFNARGRSHDFSLEELQEIIETCHLYGVKVNLAFNILIFENELTLAREALEKVLPLKPDALIIQDLGLVNLVREIAPGQVIHASTQMTVTNDLAISLLKDLRIKRYVLGRENSLSEIELIKQRSQEELEVFVHGALCVSYSGQCFTSETLGGRSANRGQCAQSCRFSYEMIVDGETKNLVDREFLVSPQDLCGLAEIPKLMEIGVSSFKVEGRLKTPEYVGSIAGAYRKAIDKVLQKSSLSDAELNSEKNRMAAEYSRGFFPGWLHGVDHQKLVDGTFNSHRGAYIGTVDSVRQGSLVVNLQSFIELQAGDGILWATGGKETETGSYIYSVQKLGASRVQIGLENGSLDGQDTSKLTNAKVYLNHSKDFKKDLQKTLVDRQKQKRIPVDLSVKLEFNEPMIVAISDGKSVIEAKSESLLQAAKTRGLEETFLSEELGAFGGSVFSLRNISFLWKDPAAKLFLNHKEIKLLRQRLTQELELARKSQTVDGFVSGIKSCEPVEPVNLASGVACEAVSAKFVLLLRDKFQVKTLTEAIVQGQLAVSEINVVILDFEFGRDYADSLKLLRDHQLKTGIATTRILKPQEYQNLKNIFSLNPDVILVRNLGAARYFTEVQKFAGELRGDFSLNVANSKTAAYLLGKGLKSLCLSYDLNFEQVAQLLENAQAQQFASRLEITVHQSMPSFHMEHCVFAAFLSQGSSFKDCGKPCEKHKLQLKDQFGNYHWIKPDHECRNTMYNSKAQTALQFVDAWKKFALGYVRFEALHEQGLELIEKIQAYRDYLVGSSSAEQSLSKISAKESYGLSVGSLGKIQEYTARKKEIKPIMPEL